MYTLVDCNNFYASCERVFNPALNGKPIAVLSNNDGCVIARSDEAKPYIPMGAPAFKFEKAFREHNINVFSSNYPLYGDMSSRVMEILGSFTPDIEVYSIDEAFLYFRGFDRYDFQAYGEKIQRTVHRSTGIPTSIGIAPTKALSKVASHIAKKYPSQTKRVYLIDSETKRIKALKWMKIKHLWGIGRGNVKKLNQLGVTNAYEFTLLSKAWIQKNMSVNELRLHYDLVGIPTITLDHFGAKKSIATTRSFDEAVYDLPELTRRISSYTAVCARKLRQQQTHCNFVHIFVRTGLFNPNDQFKASITIAIPFPTNSTFNLVAATKKALKSIFVPGHAYKKAGVIVMGLTPENACQITTYGSEDPKHKSLMSVIDQVNAKYKDTKIRVASESLDKTFKMRQEKLSKRYSTRLDEVIQVHC